MPTRTAVWCLDYLLTLDREIRYFWFSSWSFNKVLFFGYRYPPLLYIIINIFAIPPWPSWQNYHVSQFYHIMVLLISWMQRCEPQGIHLIKEDDLVQSQLCDSTILADGPERRQYDKRYM